LPFWALAAPTKFNSQKQVSVSLSAFNNEVAALCANPHIKTQLDSSGSLDTIHQRPDSQTEAQTTHRTSRIVTTIGELTVDKTSCWLGDNGPTAAVLLSLLYLLVEKSMSGTLYFQK